jgi:hypothetical protein
MLLRVESGETVLNMGGYWPVSQLGRTGWTLDDQGHGDLPLLFSPRFWTVSALAVTLSLIVAIANH